MSHVRRADWAANVPWSGILDKPAGLGGDTDIGQLKGAGFSVDDIPIWDGSQFVPTPYVPGGGSSSIGNLNSPGVATKRIRPGTTTVENVWLQEVFDIRQYGADNTGAMDSTGPINAAIDALNAAGYGALIVPAGRYRAAGPMNRILGRCWVHGDGQGSTVMEFQNDGWWVTSGSFFGCTGMTMVGTNPVGTGIKLVDTASRDNFLLYDLRVTGFGFAIDVETPNRAGWIERVRLDATELALSLNASDSFVRGISIYNGGDNTKNAFEMTGVRNQVSDFKILGDAAHFKKGLFVNDGGTHVIADGIIIGCDEEAISLSNGTGGVTGCHVQSISWSDIGTSPDVVSYDATTNWVNDLYEIGTAGGGGGGNVELVTAPTSALDPGANNQIANDGTYFYSYKDTRWYRVAWDAWSIYNAETQIWIAGIDAAGGTYEPDSKAIADALITALQAKSYNAEIIYLLPFLGGDLIAARMPLRDTLGVGIATNSGFFPGDFTQATGLQGNGSAKYLDTLVKPGQLGASDNGGIGYCENNIPGTLGANVEPMGAYNNANSNRFVLDIRAALRAFRWGAPGNGGGDTTAPGNEYWYGQRSSAIERKMFVNGLPVGTNTTSDTPSGTMDRNIYVVGANESTGGVGWLGRCAVAWMTTGNMSDADVLDFKNFLDTYLLTPTGRPI